MCGAQNTSKMHATYASSYHIKVKPINGLSELIGSFTIRRRIIISQFVQLSLCRCALVDHGNVHGEMQIRVKNSCRSLLSNHE